LVFDIAQFFPSLNHCLLPLILEKVSFNSKISIFFQDYLVGRKKKIFETVSLLLLLTLTLVLDRVPPFLPFYLLYIFLQFSIFLKKRIKNLKTPISILSFVNNSLFIVQDKSLTVSNSHLFCSYHIMSSLLKQFGLVIEHGKTEVFHFSRLHVSFNPPLLNLTSLGGPILHSKEM